jgi:predicted DCC family thiol-disulfide oxidoreductase YuxK
VKIGVVIKINYLNALIHEYVFPLNARTRGTLLPLNRILGASHVGEKLMSDHPIILFDGVCNMCNEWVKFLIRRDPQGIFRYTALQSQTGQRLLVHYQLCPQSLETLVLVDGELAFTKSDAVLRIMGYLPGMWPLLGILRFVPRSLRNRAYDFIAKRRYEWFGKYDACMTPTDDIIKRFLH